MSQLDYEVLPEHIRAGVQRYVERGIIPGDFLQAVIRNNLRDSFLRADDINLERMYDIVKFFYSEVPCQCWGSHEKMIAWNEKGGLLEV